MLGQEAIPTRLWNLYHVMRIMNIHLSVIDSQKSSYCLLKHSKKLIPIGILFRHFITPQISNFDGKSSQKITILNRIHEIHKSKCKKNYIFRQKITEAYKILKESNRYNKRIRLLWTWREKKERKRNISRKVLPKCSMQKNNRTRRKTNTEFIKENRKRNHLVGLERGIPWRPHQEFNPRNNPTLLLLRNQEAEIMGRRRVFYWLPPPARGRRCSRQRGKRRSPTSGRVFPSDMLGFEA